MAALVGGSVVDGVAFNLVAARAMRFVGGCNHIVARLFDDLNEAVRDFPTQKYAIFFREWLVGLE